MVEEMRQSLGQLPTQSAGGGRAVRGLGGPTLVGQQQRSGFPVKGKHLSL